MFERFTPKLYRDDVLNLPFDKMWEMGIKGLIFDLDNTLTFWHDDYIRPEISDLVRNLEKQGFSLCLLSNNHGHRVQYMAEKLGIDFVKKAAKPGKKGFLQACRQMQLPTSSVAMIGDQLLTDILGANKAGVYSVLVKPMGKREMWGTMLFSRNIEKIIKPFVMKNLCRSENTAHFYCADKNR